MRKIIDNKLYDTDKCLLICEFKTKVEHPLAFGMSYYPYHYAKIYKTLSGSFLKYIGKACADEYSNYEKLELITIDEVKKIMIETDAIDEYIKLFGELEEG